MKKIILTTIDITFYMAVALGVISLLNLIFVNYSNMPTTLVVIGLSLGVLVWWRKATIVEGMRVFAGVKYLKLYVHLYQLLLYLFAACGFLELFSLYFGISSVEVYESITLSYTFSWKSVFYAIIIILGWQASVNNLYSQIMNDMQEE